jgi:hypothetical protein
MWLVLSEPDDRSALWAWKGLEARGLDPIDIVTPQQLISALRWEHRLGRDGFHARVGLHTGKTLDHDTVRGIFNRIGYLSPSLFAHAAADDRLYAMQEMNALFMSWLTAAPCPVLNRPSPQGLCGQWKHASEWAALADQAGVPAVPFRQSSTMEVAAGSKWHPPGAAIRTVLVVGAQALGPDVPADIAEGCIRLARVAGLGVAGFDFTGAPGDAWLLAGATPQPDLRAGGEPVLDALGQAMQEAAS